MEERASDRALPGRMPGSAYPGGDPPFQGPPPDSGTCLIRLRITDETVLPEIARWVVGRGVALYEMRSARKSLEAWFLEAMGDDQAPG